MSRREGGREKGGSYMGTALREVTRGEWLIPGTDPLIYSKSLSGSIFMTRKFCMVVRSPPILPGIFLFLKTRPGSCRQPVEPTGYVRLRLGLGEGLRTRSGSCW